jgi:hypothetical protein
MVRKSVTGLRRNMAIPDGHAAPPSLAVRRSTTVSAVWDGGVGLGSTSSRKLALVGDSPSHAKTSSRSGNPSVFHAETWPSTTAVLHPSRSENPSVSTSFAREITAKMLTRPDGKSVSVSCRNMAVRNGQAAPHDLRSGNPFRSHAETWPFATESGNPSPPHPSRSVNASVSSRTWHGCPPCVREIVLSHPGRPRRTQPPLAVG